MNWLRALFRRAAPPVEPQGMTLTQQHRFVSACIAHLSSSFPRYAREHGHDATAGAITSLKMRKVELEAQLEVLKALNESS